MQSYFWVTKAPCCPWHSCYSWLNLASPRPLVGNTFNSDLSSMNVDTIHKPEIKEPAHLNRAKGNNRLLLRTFTDNYTHLKKKKKRGGLLLLHVCLCIACRGERITRSGRRKRERELGSESVQQCTALTNYLWNCCIHSHLNRNLSEEDRSLCS